MAKDTRQHLPARTWRWVHHGPFRLMIVGGDGEQHGQYGAGPGRAVHGHAAAHRLHPVTQPGQARPAAGRSGDAASQASNGQHGEPGGRVRQATASKVLSALTAVIFACGDSA